MLSCPAGTGAVGADRCGGRLAREHGDGYRCERCRQAYGAMRGVPRLTTERATSAYGGPLSLAAYHEMHYAAFVASDAPGRQALVGEADGPAFHVAELHRTPALTEGFYAGICAVIDEAVGPIAGRVALDVACATGRMSAELAARRARVLGVDLSEEFVDEAQRILLDSAGRPELTFVEYKTGPRSVRAELPWRLSAAELMFAVADAARLPVDDGAAHLVLMLNLIDCVPAPGAALLEAWRCVAPGGYLLHADPYDYLRSTGADGTMRLHDLEAVFAGVGGELVLTRSLAFPIRLGWSHSVAANISEVSLYRKA